MEKDKKIPPLIVHRATKPPPVEGSKWIALWHKEKREIVGWRRIATGQPDDQETIIGPDGKEVPLLGKAPVTMAGKTEFQIEEKAQKGGEKDYAAHVAEQGGDAIKLDE